jgi:hypothetical protein
MRTPAQGPFRAFITLSNEFMNHPDYRWYINNVMFNLAQITRQPSLAHMHDELQSIESRCGMLAEVATQVKQRLLPATVVVYTERPLTPSPLTEWVLFKACVYAMINIMTTERSESWMRRFESICRGLYTPPCYIDRLEGCSNRALEFVRVARLHVHAKCYRQTTKRMFGMTYLTKRMRSADVSSPASGGTCSICMKRVRRRHVALECGHVFHKACMLAWLCKSTRSTCPVCRRCLHV